LTVKDKTPVPTTAQAPRSLRLLGRELPVRTARAVSAGLLVAGALGGLLLAVIARLLIPASEGAGIRRRYAQLLVRVQPMPTPPGRPVVDVTDFATLAKLADRYGLLVMHWSRSDVETFVVQDEGTTYRYRTGVGPSPSRSPVPAQSRRPRAEVGSGTDA
jgi:hypothetical protein